VTFDFSGLFQSVLLVIGDANSKFRTRRFFRKIWAFSRAVEIELWYWAVVLISLFFFGKLYISNNNKRNEINISSLPMIPLRIGSSSLQVLKVRVSSVRVMRMCVPSGRTQVRTFLKQDFSEEENFETAEHWNLGSSSADTGLTTDRYEMNNDAIRSSSSSSEHIESIDNRLGAAAAHASMDILMNASSSARQE